MPPLSLSAMPLTPRTAPDEAFENDVFRRFGESVIATEQRLELERLQLLLRALRGEREGIPADVLASVDAVAPDGRPTYGE